MLAPKEVTMSQTAKLFANGRSQAVRLPAAFRFDTSEVFIRQDPATGDVAWFFDFSELKSENGGDVLNGIAYTMHTDLAAEEDAPHAEPAGEVWGGRLWVTCVGGRRLSEKTAPAATGAISHTKQPRAPLTQSSTLSQG